MSWLKNVAGKAEDFLNNLDAAAGETIANTNLKDTLQSSMTPSRSFNRLADLQAQMDDRNPSPSSNAAFSRSSSQIMRHTPSHSREHSSVNIENSYHKSDHQASSLAGSSVNVQVRKHESVPPSANLNRDSTYNMIDENQLDLSLLSRASGNSSPHLSGMAGQNHLELPKSGYTTPSANNQTNQNNHSSRKISQDSDSYLPTNIQAQTSIPVLAQHQSGPSNYELSVLKSELDGMNKELSRYLDKCQSQEKEIVSYKKQIRTQEQSLNEYSVDMSNYKSINFQQMEEIDYMKNDLIEKNCLIDDLTSKLNQTTEQANHLMYTSTHQKDVHNTTFETLTEKMEQMEVSLQNEVNSKRKLEIQIDEEKNKSSIEKSELSKAITEKEMALDSERRKANSLSISYKQMKAQLDTIQQELADYKNKAQRILQSKERLIDNLKSANSVDGTSLSNSENSTENLSIQNEALALELDKISHERDDAKHEVHKLKQRLNDLEIENSDIELRMSTETNDLMERISEIRAGHELERNSKIEAEKEVSRLRKKQSDLQEDLTNRKHEYSNRLQKADADLCRLRGQC